MRKYYDVEKMLRKYRDCEYILQELRQERKATQESIKEITYLKSTLMSDMPKVAGKSDPVFESYVKGIEKYEEKILKINKQIDEIEDFREEVIKKLSKLEAKEQAIIKWKYIERLSEKMILYKLKKEFNYPVSRSMLSCEIMPNIYNQL